VRGKAGRSAKREPPRGQVLLETVLVMPLMIVIVLGILQLTEIEQARIMTEYAAFSAARTGIVWNGNNERMRDAALFALLPTFGKTDSTGALAATWVRQRAQDEAFTTLPWSTPIPATLNGVPLNGIVRVDTINPAGSDELGRVWNLRGGADWKELDFDAAYTYPEAAGLSHHFDSFEDPNKVDEDQELYRRANLLSIRVRYWYELRIPLANWFLFLSWYAANANVSLHGAVDRPTLKSSANALNRTFELEGLEGQAARISNQKGFPTAYQSEMRLLWALATGRMSLGLGKGRRFFIPLSATYSMRMQSNFYRKWLMHDRGG
jgi:hypothetical protein